jgi:hypothetical protein
MISPFGFYAVVAAGVIASVAAVHAVGEIVFGLFGG